MQITAVLFPYSHFLAGWKSSLRGWGIYVQIRIDHGNFRAGKNQAAESRVTDSCNVFVILVYASLASGNRYIPHTHTHTADFACIGDEIYAIFTL